MYPNSDGGNRVQYGILRFVAEMASYYIAADGGRFRTLLFSTLIQLLRLLSRTAFSYRSCQDRFLTKQSYGEAH